jgi:Tfp pilus assembly protein PilN
MLSLVKKHKLGTAAIPSNLTTLSVSWLNNQFKAVAIHRGTVVGTWERPGDTDGPDRFETFIREAGQHTNFRGQSVSLILAHPRLVQQLIEVPPVKGHALDKVIQRQAQQQKMFTGEAAFTSQLSPSDKVTQRVVLHLFPKLLLNQFIQGCRRNGLHLNSVIPASAVVQHQLTQLGIDKDEIGLVAADTGGTTTMVAGTGEGKIYLARTLSGNWNGEIERLAVDLNRTVLFVNQQYSVTINKGLWVFGPNVDQKCEALENIIPLPVEESPVEYDPFYWATQAVKLRPETAPNLISRELRQAPQRRVFASVVGVATALVVAACLLSAGFFMRQAQQESRNIDTLNKQFAKLQTAKAETETLDRELSHKKQVIKLVIGERPPPTPAWFLAYLGEAVPSDLVVTNLQISRKDDFYTVLVSGTFQAPLQLGQPASQQITDPVELFRARLSAAPFHLKLTERQGDSAQPLAASQPPKAATPAQAGIPAWLSRLTTGAVARSTDNKPVRRDNFIIEGVMK